MTARKQRTLSTWLGGASLALLLALSGVGLRAQAPLKLFDGSSMQGWNQHGTWAVNNAALSSRGSGERSLVSAVPFGEMSLEFEYNSAAGMGSKLRLWTDHDGAGGVGVNLDTTTPGVGVGGIESLSNSSISVLSPTWHKVQVEASKGRLSVKIDGTPAGSANNLGTRAGYIAFSATSDGALQIRGVRLSPLNLGKSFNGTDLGGWKSIAQQPNAKGGAAHDFTKAVTFGIGGGSTKPHEAKWTVVGGAIHGVDGPGGLEYANASEDGIVQLTAHGSAKDKSPTVLSVRTAAGKLEGGYGVGIGPNAGQITGVAAHAAQGSQSVEETIVYAGRTIAIWINGTLATLYTDTRAENPSPEKGAKTGGGTLTLLLPGGDEINVSRLQSTAFSPKAYGAPAKSPAPPPSTTPMPSTGTATIPATAGGGTQQPSEAEKAILAQQQAASKKDAEDQANKQKIAGLMAHALSTNDPQQQVDDYGQVIHIDPYNAAAVQGYRDAEARIQAAQVAQEHDANTRATQEAAEQDRSQKTDASLDKAKAAFLAGRLSEASAALALAERFSPGNAEAQALRSRLNTAQSVRTRLLFLGGGAGLAGVLGALALWVRRRKQQQFPHLEIRKGLEAGRSFAIDKDMVRIGAVAQNGAHKNDIVLQDMEHAISRFHCEVSRKNGQLYVTDLKSANGTLVDGQPLEPGQPRLLRRGDVITLANSVELRLDYGRRPAEQS